MHEAPVNANPDEESNHIRSIIRSLTLHCNRLFPQFKTVTTR